MVIKDDELINDNDSMEDLTMSKFGNLYSSSLYLSSESLDMEDNDLHDYVPSYIFKVNYKNCSVDGEDKVPRCIQHNQEFEKLKKEYGSFYGYHGSSFENFHSILHYGLQTNLNKVREKKKRKKKKNIKQLTYLFSSIYNDYYYHYYNSN